MVPIAKRFLFRVREFLSAPIIEELRDTSDPASQIMLTLNYRRMVESGSALPSLSDVGFKCHSQCDEDGILLFLFSIIGAGPKLCVEICAGDGMECNCANLILSHGWHGLLVDGDPANVERGRAFYARSKYTYVFPPQFVQAWITRSSVNRLLADHGFQGEVSLLSIDVDGVDYWIWESIDSISPRVVVLEYQDILGPNVKWTVPYDDHFSAKAYSTTDGMPDFAGASLSAFIALGQRKGYRLVGVNRYGFNAFFVRNDLAANLLPEIGAESCFGHRKAVWGMRERFSKIKDLPWVEV